MHDDQLITAQLHTAASQAVLAFVSRQHINDRHPEAKETFSYAAAGVNVVIEVYGASFGVGYDIEIRRDEAQVAAVWRDADGPHIAYSPQAKAILPLIVAAIVAAGSGDLILEVAPAA